MLFASIIYLETCLRLEYFLGSKETLNRAQFKKKVSSNDPVNQMDIFGWKVKSQSF